MAGVESAPPIRVLIVEQHAAVRRALRKRLGASPRLEVIAAVAEPSLALPYLNPDHDADCSNAPDVILLGLRNGPDQELFDTLDIVKLMVRCPAAVVVLAPYADEVERSLLQQAGVSRYLLKHIDSYQLIREIELAARFSSGRVVGA